MLKLYERKTESIARKSNSIVLSDVLSTRFEIISSVYCAHTHTHTHTHTPIPDDTFRRYKTINLRFWKLGVPGLIFLTLATARSTCRCVSFNLTLNFAHCLSRERCYITLATDEKFFQI